MKRICTILISLFAAGISFGQSITEVAIPKYIQAGSTTEKVPFVCRLAINGLLANTTYRYYNRLVVAADTASAGNTANGTYTIVKSSVPFQRITGTPNLTSNYGRFTTDNSGSYTGWFIHETSNAAAFAPGSTVYVRIYMNDGSADGSPTVSTIAKRISASNSPITCINFGDAATSNTGTGIRSTAATNAAAGNFVMLYDNTAGTGRPITGAVIESDGAANTSGFAPFYVTYVDGQNKTWGAIIPNNLPGGIKRIVQYGLTDGSRVGNNSSATGLWAKAGGGTVSTVNPTGTDVIALDGAVVSLPAPTSQTITFNGLADRTYGEAPFLPGAAASSGLPVIYASNNTAVADTVRINDMLRIAIKGAGTAEITATQPGDETYGAAPAVKATLTVLKANLIIKADDKSWLKGTPLPDLTVSYSGFKYDDDSNDLSPKPVVTSPASDTASLSTYPITADGAASPNYNITYVPGTFTVVSRRLSQTINFSPLPDKTYGDANFSPGATATSTLQVTYTSSDITVAEIINKTTVHIVGVGTTTITASQTGDGTYDAAPDVSVPLTVNKAMLTIRAHDKSRLFGQANPQFTFAYSGFVNGENANNLLMQPVATTSATIDSAAGTYPIKVSGAASDNYNFRYIDGILTIDPLPAQTIIFTALPVKKYGDAYFLLGARSSTGLAVTYKSSNPNVAVVVKDTVHITGAGTTMITASQAGNATNGPAPDVSQTLTVQKAPLTIRADNQTRNQGEPNPALTITYTGFINSDDSTKLTTMPQVSTVATPASVAGNYRITVQGATSPSYAINHQTGILTVLPAQGEAQDDMNAYISGPGQLQVNVYAVNIVKVSMQLFDLNGSRVANSTVTLIKGFNSYRIPLGNLSPGIYNLRVAGGDVMLKTKVVIQ
jgi:hypothetical protein